MRQELEQELYNKYPKLFRGRSLPASKSLMCFGCDHGDGWYRIIEEICSKIEGIGAGDQVEFLQIKQKFGVLRIYFTFLGDDDKVYSKVSSIISDGEKISGKVCESCGDWGTERTPSGWIKVLCDKCYEERYKPV